MSYLELKHQRYRRLYKKKANYSRLPRSLPITFYQIVSCCKYLFDYHYILNNY